MNKQTENYIVLKPIAERFNEVTQSISDDEIKNIIKDAMREQLKGIFDFSKLEELTNDYIEQNEQKILKTIEDSIINRLKI